MNKTAKSATSTKSTAALVQAFMIVETSQAEDMSFVRGAIMDELETRDPIAFDAWLDSDNEPLYKFFGGAV